MRIRLLFFNLIIICLLSSCGYKMITVTDINGKKCKERQYKSNEKEERYTNRRLYKHIYKEQQYPKYPGKISSDTIKESVFVQYDSIARIYLEDNDKEYEPIFSSGLLYPKMIFCRTDSLCTPLISYVDTVISDTSEDITAKFGKPYVMLYKTKDDSVTFMENFEHAQSVEASVPADSILWRVSLSDKISKIPPKNSTHVEYVYSTPERMRGWNEITVTIRNISELNYLEAAHKKVFKIELSTWNIFGITDYYYFLEIENSAMSKNMDLGSFVNGGKVTFFKFEYAEHEI